MKCYNLIIAAAASLALTACSAKSSDTNAESIEETTTTEEAVAATSKVIELDDVAAIAPGLTPERLTVIDFNAVWCGPCRQLAPVLDEMSVKYEGKVDFYSVDVDKFGELFEAYNVGESIPAVVFVSPDGSSTYYVGTGDLLPAEKFSAIIDSKLN